MPGYAKVFTRILDSTVWREPDTTRILWITMLALADRNGIVHCTIPGLADRARISLEECEDGLNRFQQPDKYSWSKEDDGRRIQVVEDGWFLINYPKFRGMMSREEIRENTRLRVQRYRDRKRQECNAKTLPNVTDVTGNKCNDIASASASATTSTEKSSTTAGKPARKLAHQIPENFQPTDYHKKIAGDRHVDLDAEFEQFKDFHGARGSTFKDWNLALNTWIRNAAKYARNGGNGNGNGRLSPSESRSQRSQQVLNAVFGLGKSSSNTTSPDDNQFKNRTRPLLSK